MNKLLLGLKALFSLALVGSGVMKITANPALVQSFDAMGYPQFLLTILGTSYVLGVIGIWQKVSPKVKEWAYAGFTFALIGAVWSHLAAGDPITAAVPAIVLLVLVSVVQVLEKPAQPELA